MAITIDGTNGVTTPDVEVSSGGSASAPAITVTGDTNTGIFFPAADTIAFAEGGAEAMRIDSSGNVGIGTSSPSTFGKFVTQTATSANTPIVAITDNGLSPQINHYITDSSSTVRNLNQIGFVTGSSNSANYQGYMTFSTMASAGGTISERARIDSSGNLLVGATSPAGNERLRVLCSVSAQAALFQNDNAAPYGPTVYFSSAAPNNSSQWFLYNYDTVGLKASIRSNGGIANYSANNVNLSDRREKTNFAPAKNYLDTICAIPVQTFNYIDQNNEEDDGLTLGVVAQDVQEVAPELVMESNWGTQEEPKMRLSIYQTDLQYALMKSIQELKAINDAQASRIETLEAKVAALEANNV